jgi:O-antigen/teichoic acid export membrane protein
VVGALAGFVFWMLAARLYSPIEVGLASAVISIVQLLSGIAGLGLGIGLVRFLAIADDPERMLNTAITLVVLSSLVASTVYIAGIRLWSPTLEILGSRLDHAIGFMVFLAAVALGALTNMAFVGYRQARFAFWQFVVMNGLRLLLVVTMASAGALGIVAATAFGMLGGSGLGMLVFLPHVSRGYRLRPRLSARVIAMLVPYSVGTYVADLLYRAPSLLAPPFALEMLGATSGAHAYIAWMIGLTLSSPGMALADSAFAEGTHAPDYLRMTLSRAASLGILLTASGAIIMGIFAPWFLRTFFGSSYAREATGLLRLLAASAPIAVLNTMYFTRLRIQKRVGRLMAISCIIALMTLGMTATLMPRLGIAASGVGWLAGNGLVAVMAIAKPVKEEVEEEIVRA